MAFSKKTLWRLFALGCSVVFFTWMLYNWNTFQKSLHNVLGLVFPLFLGFCIAFVLNVPMRFLERHLFPNAKHKVLCALRRPLSIVLALLFILGVIAAVMGLVVPELVKTVGVLATAVPSFLESVQQWAMDHANSYPQINEWIASLKIDWSQTGKTVLNYLGAGASNLVSGTLAVVSGIAGGAMQFTVAAIFALYILMGKEHLKSQICTVCRAFLPEKVSENLFFISRLAARTFANFVTGQCTEACILGTLCWLGMSVLRLPYAPMVGALIGFTALIPIVGAFAGTVVGAFMILMVNPIQAVWFVVFLLTLQQIEGNIIYPRVVGSSVGLPGLWVLAAVTVGGGIGGLAGMVFAVPVGSVLYTLTRLAVQERMAKKAQAQQEQAQ